MKENAVFLIENSGKMIVNSVNFTDNLCDSGCFKLNNLENLVIKDSFFEYN